MVFQLFAIFGFGMIAFQDVKERMVHWVLFPLVGIFLGLAHWQKSTPDTFLVLAVANILFVTVILLITWLYTKYISKKGFLNQSFGLGDALFLYAFALGFPTVTFVVLFVSAILFSLFLHFTLSLFRPQDTVPLAGYMSLFLIAAFILSKISNQYQLYLF